MGTDAYTQAAREVRRRVERYRSEMAQRYARVRSDVEGAPGAIDDQPATAVPPAGADLSVQACHMLDYLDSRIRHSIVESCFYSAQLLLDRLDRDGTSTEAWAQLQRVADHVPAACDQLRAYLDTPLDGDAPIRTRFPAHADPILAATARVEAAFRRVTGSRAPRAELTRAASQAVRGLMDETARLRRGYPRIALGVVSGTVEVRCPQGERVHAPHRCAMGGSPSPSPAAPAAALARRPTARV